MTVESDPLQSQVKSLGLEELPATEALALFLGDEPRVVIGRRPEQTAVETITALDDASVGSILVLAGPGLPHTRGALHTLFRECRRVVRPGGRIAVLAGHRLPLVLQALRVMREVVRGQWRSTQSVGRASYGAVLTGLRTSDWQDVTSFAVKPSADAPDTIELVADPNRGRVPAILVTAARDDRRAPHLLDTMLCDVAQGVCPDLMEGPLQLLRVHNSTRGKSVAIARSGNHRLILRIARSDAMLEDESRSYALLRSLESNVEVRGIVPRPVVEGQSGGLRFFAQTHLSGSPLSSVLSASNRSLYLAQVETYLRALNAARGEPASVTVDELYGAAVGSPMVPFVLQHVEDVALRARIRSLIDDSLRGACCRHGIVHGDFGTGNILVSGGRLTGIIDWEAAHARGLPVLDAINYLDAAQRHCVPGLSIVDTVPMLADGNWPLSGEIDFLGRMFNHHGMDFGCLRGAVILYALFHIGPQLRFLGKERGPRDRLEQLLRRLGRP